ncbi:DUF4181 domain-containing protein [Fredinandcohnia humi]
MPSNLSNEFLLFSFFFILFALLVEYVMKRKVGIKKGFKYEPYSALQKRVEYGILAVYIALVIFAGIGSFFLSFGIFITIITILRTIIEWKFARSEKNHLLFSLHLGLLAFYYLSVYLLFPNILYNNE